MGITQPDIDIESLVSQANRINAQLSRYGVKFGIYKDGKFSERLFPFDAIARVIKPDEWLVIEKGLKQRADALNLFLKDIYSEKKTFLKDKKIPQGFLFSTKSYLPECEGFEPPKGIYSHISGIDLVESKEGGWVVLEDNLRVPSGASYPLIARDLCRKCSPSTFRGARIVDSRNYGVMLKEAMDNVNCGGINVILSPGRYNAAYFEHSLLAEWSMSALAEPSDLVVEDNCVYYRTYDGQSKVGAIYRRISDAYLDPLNFWKGSLIGVPNLFSAYRSGSVAIINAPGSGAADDKGIYYFVPQMIKHYLSEDPILKNAPTYLPYFESGMKYIKERLSSLVVKDVSESGGYGVIFGQNLSKQGLSDLKDKIIADPRRFVAQELIDFKGMPIISNGEKTERKADFRAYVITSDTTNVWKSGLSRFSTGESSYLVNSSQGGGFKDTWVLY